MKPRAPFRYWGAKVRMAGFIVGVWVGFAITIIVIAVTGGPS